MPGYRMLAYRGAAFGEINTAVHEINAKRGAALAGHSSRSST
jgi:hypothetical protein